MTFAQALLAYRIDRGLSQTQAAREFNVAEATIRNWERGRTQPHGTAVKFLEERLGIHIDV